MVFAVHISDGVLRPLWWVSAWLIAALLVVIPLRRADPRELPRLGLAAALFFVASSVHFPFAGGRVHLLFTGLVGALAGLRAGAVVAVGLVLQNRLIGHGGFTSLGFNAVSMGLPAVILGCVYRGCEP